MNKMARQQWMGVLARASTEVLENLIAESSLPSAYDLLRGPETGLVMVRGRVGGTGQPFNVGETTVTRCSVRLAGGAVGHSMVSGRRPEHARRAALIDAAMQDEAERERLLATVIVPLARAEAEFARQQADEAAATKVDFFTLVRGEDE